MITAEQVTVLNFGYLRMISRLLRHGRRFLYATSDIPLIFHIRFELILK